MPRLRWPPSAIRSEFPSVTDFERDFPSLCFALATGVGKTRLMGAFISYLHLAHGINNFFVLAPNLTLVSPVDKSNISRYLLGGFKRCLYSVQTFDSDSERVLSVICDRDAERWFKPARGQFQIFYRHGADHSEYQPDFVAETGDAIYMLEPKMKKEMDDPVVLAKKAAAVKWCGLASEYAKANGGKPWR